MYDNRKEYSPIVRRLANYYDWYNSTSQYFRGVKIKIYLEIKNNKRKIKFFKNNDLILSHNLYNNKKVKFYICIGIKQTNNPFKFQIIRI